MEIHDFSLGMSRARTDSLGHSADGNAVLLMQCECGEVGCWPLLAKLEVTDTTVTWSDFQQPHRGPQSPAGWWRYDNLGPFSFDRVQYEAALARMQAELAGEG